MFSTSMVIVLILLLATTIQSVVGFGLALFAVPLLLLTDLGLLPSIFLVLSISFFSAIVGVYRLRDELDFKRSVVASLYRGLGVVPGYFAAAATAQSSPAVLKAAIGFAIGLGVLAQAKKLTSSKPKKETEKDERTEPSERIAPLAFASSGFLMGWLGMGGPPLIFWLLTGRQDAKKSRSFLYGVYILTIPFQLALMAWFNPEIPALVGGHLLIAVPASLIVSAIALRWGDRLDVDRLQWMSLVLLSILALKAIFDWLQQVL